MKFEDIDITGLLPQKKPFVMVGRLKHFDMLTTITETVVERDNLMVDDGRFSASGVMENIAQTCAVRIGYINKYILKKDINIGFIGAIRNLHIYRLPEVGELLTTEINVMEEVFGMTLVKASVKSSKGKDEALVCESEMKIALSEKTV